MTDFQKIGKAALTKEAQNIAQPRQKHTPGETAFEETLASTIERVGDLKDKTDKALQGGTKVDLQGELDSARELYDRMMTEKQNLARIYQRLTEEEKA